MRKRTMKSIAVLVASGFVFQCGGGCLNLGGLTKWAGPLLYDGALDIVWEYVWDNDGVYDLVQD